MDRSSSTSRAAPTSSSSERGSGWSFGPAQAITELNSTSSDIQPNVRKDGHEVVFASNRSGTLGAQDIWISTREDTEQPLLGSREPRGGREHREQRDAPLAFLGRPDPLLGRSPVPTGPGDIYMSTREKHTG